MAKTTAERQKECRARRPYAAEKGDGEKRVSSYVSSRAALALNRLAKSCGITKREMLEKLLIGEDDKILRGLDLDTREGRKYLSESDQLRWFSLTRIMMVMI
jgi:hypothetical protein